MGFTIKVVAKSEKGLIKPKKAPHFHAGASKKWCLDPGLNQGHADFQSAALPTELSRHET